MKIAKEISERTGEGKAYVNCGFAWPSLCDFRKAIECHKNQLKIAMEFRDRAGEGEAYGNLSNS